MQKLLNQAERADPATDRTAEYDAEQGDDAKHIPPGLVTGGGQCVLDGAKRTGANGSGAGITVKSRHTGVFCLTNIDFAIDEALKMGVIEQRTVQLNQPPGAGPVALQPG